MPNSIRRFCLAFAPVVFDISNQRRKALNISTENSSTVYQKDYRKSLI